MRTYDVSARRWKRGWELHIDGVGVTQSRRLRDAEAMARDLIARRTGEPPDSFAVDVVPDLDGLEKEAIRSREHTASALQETMAAAAQARSVARRLHERGLSGDDTAAVLGVSKGRVSQLIRQ